ncbi:MAG: KH domain-containing protein [Candidatus Parvarchaeota archaeon]|nr:KH domain-containing protein [Candidatus Jingweiarchaeum tengchongense]MCW1300105.1 KH domain-containing protein [Candidatus Jingweiarchaeum tengchongense]MCW1304459.1 KH domain-containing protein [Candidatus Jingweiarchaeum tengchongense]MCW1305626.1 KH domain-containing protein [Candidatus Jingweiarchaeum tengchongense]MCW1309253.1 KH domain-containing protein [Candidatus Jingweiarchaeum tengchongense]
MKFTQIVKVPKERINVIIGKGGEVKKKIEEETNTKIKISEEGVSIEGDDSVMVWIVRDLIRAIARGFSPEKAFRLLNEENIIEIIDLTEYAGKSKNALVRLKGRIIGKEGKARKLIEELSETYISVYGKSVALIGKIENIEIARRAIIMLLEGARHATVYRMLERERRRLKEMVLL